MVGSYLKAESFGWLLIDEAGQALPQAAVGALFRSRRALVVGDPIQLPPVTSLPSALAEKIAGEFKVDVARFVAPEASAQTLADATSVYGTTIATSDANLRVGVPLVVHRRCTEPMFSLSNTLAYGGMMVHGRGEKPSKIQDILGPSAWFDVKPGHCEDKWSEAEGLKAVDLLRELDRAGLKELDVYLVSPFRIAAQKLRELLVAKNVLSRWTDDPRGWVRNVSMTLKHQVSLV
jgi:superfamily I DNA and/or RNA helicase